MKKMTARVILENRIKELVVRFKENMAAKEELLKCFCRYGVQLEGWLKGELLYFFDKEKREGHVVDFDREVSTPRTRKKVDFKVKMSTSSGVLDTWIELKYWLIGYQKGTKYGANFYFGDPSSVGIKPDVEKLNTITDEGKFILVLAVANPGSDEWSNGIDNFNRKFSPLHLKSLTDPTDYPDSYFLGLLSVR